MKTQSLHNQLVEWRHDLHMHPQLSFEEEYAAAKVSLLLKEFGIEVHSGIARTGVVGILKKGNSSKSIGIRADMDALPIHERNNLEYKSINDDVMHACGHDTHMAILMATAEILSKNRDFPGTVKFIFQPAEEGQGGARYMIEDGCLDGVKEIYGLHLWNYQHLGDVGVKSGPVLAAADIFEITIKG